MSLDFPTVRSRITLKKAVDRDSEIWVAESPGVVRGSVNAKIEAGQGEALVTFSRIVGMRLREFSTQANNVLSVSAVDQ